ncbi:hypothetical protein QJQ45_016428 [Haematococcus lacustris]|nr:hypothetical protein QJQ45_016428 [Haematococcus lacustris]
MVKFLKSGKVVVVLTGRFAGKKAVIVRNFDDGTTSRPYGHALVVGLQKEPRKTFIKTINYTHLMPTRYTLAVDFKNVTTDVVDDATKKVEARKDCKKLLEEQFKTGKNRLQACSGAPPELVTLACAALVDGLIQQCGSSPSCVSERPYLSTLIRQPSQLVWSPRLPCLQPRLLVQQLATHHNTPSAVVLPSPGTVVWSVHDKAFKASQLPSQPLRLLRRLQPQPLPSHTNLL